MGMQAYDALVKDLAHVEREEHSKHHGRSHGGEDHLLVAPSAVDEGTRDGCSRDSCSNPH